MRLSTPWFLQPYILIYARCVGGKPCSSIWELRRKNFRKYFHQVQRLATYANPLCRRLAFPTSTRIVTGAYDHVAGALGAGNFREGSVSETTGTDMAMVVTLDRLIPNYVINIPMQCHAVPGKYLLLPYGQTAGFVLKWFKDQFWKDEMKRESWKGEDVYDYLTAQAEEVPAGADGLIMLPHLMGSGSPEFDTRS